MLSLYNISAYTDTDTCGIWKKLVTLTLAMVTANKPYYVTLHGSASL